MTRDSDETDVESTESRDACPSEDDVEISSFENESEESESASANSSESGFLLLTKTTRDEEMGSSEVKSAECHQSSRRVVSSRKTATEN